VRMKHAQSETAL